ncbi:glycosyltransferase family 2 protein [Acidobacteria bacterium AH-259-D05]|nr:glycosyltransferase family 2 protein [Acidobacteria bacterium AH-259-D05]
MNSLVSVIVVNYNRAELLRQCLLSLIRQSFSSLEILVVDNGSSDDSLEVVRSFSDERVRLLPLGQNAGFSGGNNLAIGQTNGEFIALINNDAVADERWIDRLMKVITASEPSIGMWASKVLFFETDIIDKVGHLIYPDGQNRGRGTGERDAGQYEQVEETLFPDGCAAAYRKSMLDEVGGFDESFFAYGDDADLGIRGHWMGWKCLYVPDAVVYHRHSSTSGRFSMQKIYWIERNRLWLAIKNFPLPLLVISPLFTLNRWLWNFFAALLQRGAAGNFRRQASLWALVQTLGRAYRDGFRQLGKMIEKRRRIRQTRRISALDFYRVLFRFRISARILAFQDLDFDYSEKPLFCGNPGNRDF